MLNFGKKNYDRMMNRSEKMGRFGASSGREGGTKVTMMGNLISRKSGRT